ncbi:Phosphatidylinositol-glycan biosynthesis class X protein [Armadillidium nasatum]|uniref:Phosphatidylinositol-glycan biosynthesis class X protein n=1 Tax=Armadillidium nasatum TaxID=96803 RepID=A0A5N5T523_9CRUS|nr:Phosphatidylinositol-glycan biosynthesis class X protein [Armadillidium nasatum]
MKPTSLLFIFLNLLCNQEIYALDEVCSVIRRTNVQVERELTGNGFHRKLHTSLVISTPVNLESCHVLVKEIIPSGAYCDPNELNFWKEFGGPSFFIPQFVNVEAPQQLSPKIQSYFFTIPKLIKPSVWHSNISGSRTYALSQGSREKLEERIAFPHPSIYLFCETEILDDACVPLAHLEPCPPSGVQQCDWIPINTFSTSDWVEARIPVGNADLIDTVLLTTTTVTFGATLLLLVSIVRNTQNPYLFNRKLYRLVNILILYENL